MGMIKVVGLVLHPRRDCGSAIDAIVEWAARREVTVLGLHDEINRIDCDAVAVSTEEMVERASMLVSLGGDGTMLRTMRLVEGRKTPVLGVNVGRLGFLAEVDLPDLHDALDAIDRHAFTIEPREFGLPLRCEAGERDGERWCFRVQGRSSETCFLQSTVNIEC